MKKLCELIDCEYDPPIDRVVVNSKEAGKGALFVCTDMGTSDRHAFIDDAIARGVSAVVVKRDVGEKSVPIIRVDDPNEVMPLICEKLYDHPLSDMTVIGVTGTDGKTDEEVHHQIGEGCGSADGSCGMCAEPADHGRVYILYCSLKYLLKYGGPSEKHNCLKRCSAGEYLFHR